MPTDTPDPWAAATFQGNEREQLRRGARMTFTEKMYWLEEAGRIAAMLEESRKRQQQEPKQASDK